MVSEDIVRVENIKKDPVKGFHKVGHVLSPKGAATYLNVHPANRFVGLIEFVPGTGIRGNHFHKYKVETMYVLYGVIEAGFWLPDFPEKKQVLLLGDGDLFTIPPGVVHAFEAKQPSLMVETSPQEFDPSDVIYFDKYQDLVKQALDH